jgi:phosphatidate cytidylyltransferase
VDGDVKQPDLAAKKAPIAAPAADAAKAAEAQARWQSVMTRTKSSLIMIAVFFVLVYLGHLALFFLTVACQVWIFKELLDLRDRTVFRKLKEDRTPNALPRALDWFFFLTTLLFCYGRIFTTRFENLAFGGPDWLVYLSSHYSILSFLFYCLAMVAFVMQLEPGMYKMQFKQLAWTALIILITTFQSSFYIHNIFAGMIWFFLPVSLVVTNDIFAYLVGFFFGRTPLIRLSPKKTWEGFIGGTIFTYIFAIGFSSFLSQFEWMTCPDDDPFKWELTCTPDSAFQWHSYILPTWLATLLGRSVLWYLPVQLHSLGLATFASLIAPFGGFFASGFKRGLNIKDFGESIPGHGGVTDRMDCQLLMGVFSYLYVANFVKTHTDLRGALALVMGLKLSDQLDVYQTLQKHLQQEGALAQ